MSDIDLTIDFNNNDDNEKSVQRPKSVSVSKSVSKSVSSKGSRSPKKDNISVAHLNILANHDKLYKPATEEPNEEKSVSSNKSKSRSKSMSRSRSRPKANKTREKQIEYENSITDIFHEKSTIMYKLEKLGFSRFTVEKYLLVELEQELTRRLKDLENKNGVSWCKKGLLYTVQGIELANTNYGFESVDLEGWSQSLEYAMEVDKNWDIVLEELYEKYSVSQKLSPELRLLFMLVMSGVSFAGMKKINKHKDMLLNMFKDIPQNPTRNYQRNYKEPESDSEVEIESRIPEPSGVNDMDLEQIMEKMSQFKEKQSKKEEIVVSIPPKKTRGTRGKGRGVSRQVILE
jgi:hypothetical protein